MAIVIYVMMRYSNVVLFLIALTYMFSGIWARAAYGWARRRRRRPQAAHAAAPDTLADPLEEEETEKRDSLRYL